MMAEQKRLLAAAANERDRRKPIPDNPKKIDWVFWIILFLVIVL